MQRIETMTFGDGIIGAIASGLVGWFIASVTKVNKSEFKEALARIAALELNRVTPEAFDRRFSQLEESLREFRTEIKADIREIKAKV